MAKYNVKIKKSAVKEIERLPRKALRVVMGKMAALADDPRPPGSKKLSGDDKYRLRCGDYRILYCIDDQIVTVYVVRVAHRKEVYRQNLRN